ncbi:thrombospondin type 3 repeat-containing protein, partial [Porticoccaceae bacterium]|nr:thrombospondin type 3 repeat-containing protein [Porticoccaceae bacterium]
ADTDDDNDGVPDTSDAFPLDVSESVDTDGDGIGNNADTDDDNDGVPDTSDALPLDVSESVDTDDDGIGNNADTDDDNDGVPDTSDAFPLDVSESVDTDGDGIGNNADTDDDNDGISDLDDYYPSIALDGLVDTDGDGIPDACDALCQETGMLDDLDDDNDGTHDERDAFPLDDSETMDTDTDGLGNNADPDDDNDGVQDTDDVFPLVAYENNILVSDLASSKYGTLEFAQSYTNDPDIRLGFQNSSIHLLPIDDNGQRLFWANQNLSPGTWLSIANGYELIWPTSPFFNSYCGEDLVNYPHNLHRALTENRGFDCISMEFTVRSSVRMGVISKGDKRWTVVYQAKSEYFAAGDTLVIDPEKPIYTELGDVRTYQILAPNWSDSLLNNAQFDESEVLGTWMIGGINLDILQRPEHENSSVPEPDRCINSGFCTDLVTFEGGGIGKTELSGRDISWSLTASGSISIIFEDTGVHLEVTRLEKHTDSSTAQITSTQWGNGPFISVAQLMVKKQEDVQLDDFFFEDYLVSGNYVANPNPAVPRSSLDNELIFLQSLKLNADNTGVAVLPMGSYELFDYLEEDLTWEYSIGGPLKIRFCYDSYLYGQPVPMCDYEKRIWLDIVSVTDDRIYVVDTYHTAFSSSFTRARPNFYERAPYFDPEDIDRDGVSNENDVFPIDPLESSDLDGDGIGDNSDQDRDGDGVANQVDGFPEVSIGDLIDTDNDGIPDACDSDCQGLGMEADDDDDGDGVADVNDSLPLDPTNDSDGDGVSNNNDRFPENSLYSQDTDFDGMPDSWETRYGLDPNDASDATSDQDNDGVTALDEFLAGTIPSGSLDIDGNEDYDALTDGLLLLRGMFGLDGSALVTGTIASDAAYTESLDIESRIEALGELADIDGNGQIDALTDGLLTLRYLFGLQGDTLINGVVAGDATRTTSEEIEAYLATLMPSL